MTTTHQASLEVATLAPRIGDNADQITIQIEVRLFNSLQQYAGPDGWRSQLELPAGATVGDLVKALDVPSREIFVVFCNGRDVTRGLVGAPVNLERALDDGDVVALSGPVPYSYGLGAPVV